MNFSPKYVSFILRSFLFLLCMAPSLFGEPFKSYKDKDDNKISFVVAKKDENFDATKEICVSSFHENYKILEPSQIKPHFKSHDDTRNWLMAVFEEEKEYYQNAEHPTYWINVLKNDAAVGFALFEQWKPEDPHTWHIRLLAVSPNEQKKGYGTQLIWSIFDLEKDIAKLVADTRQLNPKGKPFFLKKLGFQQSWPPHNPELDPQEAYIGLEWKKTKQSD